MIITCSPVVAIDVLKSLHGFPLIYFYIIYLSLVKQKDQTRERKVSSVFLGRSNKPRLSRRRVCAEDGCVPRVFGGRVGGRVEDARSRPRPALYGGSLRLLQQQVRGQLMTRCKPKCTQ